jgi:PHD/YefM family antitoxin component YafN of YafNO toxin-antitoxin module
MTIALSQLRENLLDKLFQKYDELVVSVRGKKKFVVMDIERYNELRIKELENSYREVMEDYEKGNYSVVSAKEHLEKLKRELNV